ncbi:MAG: putative glycoside hydrolase [Candidatus Eisenbacteria bacterium]
MRHANPRPGAKHILRPSYVMLWLLWLVALSLRTSPAFGGLPEDHYPKLGLVTREVGEMSPTQLDTLARYDLIAFDESPYIVAQVRQRNPEARLFWFWMPQNVVRWSENETFWYPDTTWSLIRLAQYYAQKNDWYLRDIHGQRISEWDGYAANWTRYCPKGIYGTSRGLNYVEWLTQVAIPQITRNPLPGARWGWDSLSYQGIFFEVLVDCVGSFGWQRYQNADPDRDGKAEGVYHTCSLGGDQDSLSILYREMNEYFHDHLWSAVGDDMPIVLNAANPFINPAWWTDVSGIKLESWMGPEQHWWQDWGDWFYGLRDWSGKDLWGPGYRWAEWYVGHNGDGPREGWDLSSLQVHYTSSEDPAAVQQRKRFGLGTTLLGNGYFMFTKDQWQLAWQPEYDIDLGRPLTDMVRETYRGQTLTDTLYVRVFEHGVIEVNPNGAALRGVPAEDSRWSLWRTLDDLSAFSTGSEVIRVTLHAPPSEPNPVDRFELRYSTQPIDASNWHSATAYAGNPVEVAPGSTIELPIIGLTQETTYYVAVRNWVRGRIDPNLSNLAEATTLDPGSDPPAEVPMAGGRAPSLRAQPTPAAGRLVLWLNLDRAEEGTLELLDATGRSVRVLKPTAPQAAGRQRILFDGRDDRGHLLPNGVYWARFRGSQLDLKTRVVIAR